MRAFRFSLVLISIACLLMGAQPAWAGWGLPSLNPFSWNEKSTPTKSADSSWSLPKLPGFGGKRNTTARSRTTNKSLLTKTKETLLPWTKTPATPVQITGTRKTYDGGSFFANEQEETSKSFFSSWWGSSEPEPRQHFSPHEWLGNPMP